MEGSAVEAVLEDVIDRLIEEHGMEITVLDWGILEDIKDAFDRPKDTSENSL
jgi:hypothetical protein